MCYGKNWVKWCWNFGSIGRNNSFVASIIFFKLLIESVGFDWIEVSNFKIKFAFFIRSVYSVVAFS
jgi:hypothetical protein